MSGDGAKWITECVNSYTPECARCVDSFHVVDWAMTALDKVRRDVRHDAYDEYMQIEKENLRPKGRPKADNASIAMFKAAEAKAEEIKASLYALGKAPEHLTQKQQVRVNMIASANKQLYRAYLLKEQLQLLLKIADVDTAEEELMHWLWEASHKHNHFQLFLIALQKNQGRCETLTLFDQVRYPNLSTESYILTTNH